jgi:hypothetical protein
LYARLWAHQSGGFLGEETEDAGVASRQISEATLNPS